MLEVFQQTIPIAEAGGWPEVWIRRSNRLNEIVFVAMFLMKRLTFYVLEGPFCLNENNSISPMMYEDSFVYPKAVL